MSRMPQIPGYQLIKKLGQGGMADVYLGVQEKLQRNVAIKVMVPALFRDEQFSKRFIKEAQTAAQLSHPNIITIHDVGEADHSHYIVMEYLEETLSDRVAKQNYLEPKVALEIVKMIASALDYAHKKGFIHRDIKSDNIMFRSDGTVVLVDFGIARAMDSSTHLTRTGMSIGTPHYMSPEQCKGERIDGRSDIYSLGVQLYEMLTGTLPYQAENTAGIIIKQIQEPVPTLPASLSQYQFLIDKMMAKNRNERIQSGAELIKFIEGILTAQAQHFMPPPTTGPEETVILDGSTIQPPISPYRKHATTKSRLENAVRHKWLIPTLIIAIVVVITMTLIVLMTRRPEEINTTNESIQKQQEIQPETFDKSSSQGVGDGGNIGSYTLPGNAEKNNSTNSTTDESLNANKTDNSDKTEKTDDLGNSVKKNNTGNRNGGVAPPTVNEPGEKNHPEGKITIKPKEKDDTKVPVENKKKTTQKTPVDKIPPQANEVVRTVSLLGLAPDLQQQNAKVVQRIQIPVIFTRFQVKGQVTLELLINEHGRVTIISYQDMLTVIPAIRERQVIGSIKHRFDTMVFPLPKDDQGKPVRFKWRLTFKVGKYQDRIILNRQ